MPVMIDRRELKAEARALMQSSRVSPFRFTLLFLAINLVLELISTAASYMIGDTLDFSSLSLSFSFVSILVSLLDTVLLAGYTCYGLGVHRGSEMPYNSLFDAFPFAGKVILLTVLQGVLIGVGIMLFVVPGVVFAFAYAFALYHLCEGPELGVMEAMRRSRIELRGYKMELFLLIASFLPLLFLCALPIGLCEYYLEKLLPQTLGGELLHSLIYGLLAGCASMYMMPYMALAQIGFYRRVTALHEPPEDAENEENRLN